MRQDTIALLSKVDLGAGVELKGGSVHTAHQRHDGGYLRWAVEEYVVVYQCC